MELIKDMVKNKKTNNTTYVRVISDNLKNLTPNFKLICDNIDTIPCQYLAKVITKNEVCLDNPGTVKCKNATSLRLLSRRKQGDCPNCDGKHPYKKPSGSGRRSRVEKGLMRLHWLIL